jgi:hypothetical protein
MGISTSELETQQIFWMQLNIHTNDSLAVNNDFMRIYTTLLTIKEKLGHGCGERQLSVNNFRSWEYLDWDMICGLLFITNVLASLIGQT